MPKDQRDILEVLKFELSFLEQGGYGRLPREAWRARLVFLDSPTCINFNHAAERIRCAECELMPLVPEAARDQETPCNHIPLTRSGDTLESLYRTGTQREIEAALGSWLRATIQRVEGERAGKAANL